MKHIVFIFDIVYSLYLQEAILMSEKNKALSYDIK